MRSIQRCNIVVLFFTMAVCLVANAPTASAYTSAYTNYETEHDIRTETDPTHTFSVVKSKPGASFKVFIPPGTTYINLMLYAERDALIGAAARLGAEPNCGYNLSLSDAQFAALPWISSNAALALSDFRVKDVQMKNRGGTIRILQMVVDQITGAGEWLNIQALTYDKYTLGKFNYTVTVDTAAYNAWYNTDPFNAQGQPAGTSGSSGGSCAVDWSEGCQGSGCGGENPNPTPTGCDNSGSLGCLFSGGVWNSTTCSCSTTTPTTGGTVTITSPANGSTVSGQVTITATFSGAGASNVGFVVQSSTGSPFSLGTDTTASGGVYSVAWNTTGLVGTYTITATAHGPGGSSLGSGTTTVTASGSGSASDLTVTITSPAHNSSVQGSIALTMEAVSAGGEYNVVSVEYKVDGATVGSAVASSPFSKNFDTRTVSNGSHTLTAQVTDDHGGVSTSGNYTIIVNNGSTTLPDAFDPDQVFAAEVFPVGSWRIVEVDGPIDVKPVLEFPVGLEGVYDCYAAYAKDGDIYIAEPDISGEYIFQRFRIGDSAKTFERKTFTGDTFWAPEVFSGLPTPDMNIVKNRWVIFLLAVAPVGGDTLEGVIFTYRD